MAEIYSASVDRAEVLWRSAAVANHLNQSGPATMRLICHSGTFYRETEKKNIEGLKD